MKVRDLLERLSTVDPESVVLFLEAWSWVDEADEIATVTVPKELWTFEESSESGNAYSIFYPGNDRNIGERSRHNVRQREVRVVILSNGTTNLERGSEPLDSDSDVKQQP
ncbi:hypothetical protein FSB08_14140 [Paraburkholderia sp. JPY432]|uniref:hypothetical protein n=1 Tax=Paraburkholderia youngii TaxID=2782701 RepID=UPI0015956466|nr:hypothetical protein [Paraburkholderia youngii]NVH73676.1 hypothetical protein [Paraburkholderia youngii]